MENCIFCKIAKGEVPCTKIYEDDEVLAFLDIMPVHKGHTLVIPKKHYEVITDIPSEEFAKLMLEVHNITEAVMEATGAHGFNIINNNRKAGNQDVPHVHFHIIPRFNDDSFFSRWPTTKYDDDEILAYAEKITNLLK